MDAPLCLQADDISGLVELDSLQLEIERPGAREVVADPDTPQQVDAGVIIRIDRLAASSRRVIGTPDCRVEPERGSPDMKCILDIVVCSSQFLATTSDVVVRRRQPILPASEIRVRTYAKSFAVCGSRLSFQ